MQCAMLIPFLFRCGQGDWRVFRQCEVCGRDFLVRNGCICPQCLEEIPKTYAWLMGQELSSCCECAEDAQACYRDAEEEWLGTMADSVSEEHETAVDDQWIPPLLDGASSILPLFIYRDTSPIRRLVALLKYRGRFDIAQQLGCYWGDVIREARPDLRFDAVVPVPLHALRYWKRGYNQAEHFALGISRSLDIPCWNLLRRRRYTVTQTRQRDAEARRQNVKGVFTLRANPPLDCRHLLLVDDVMTTGATLGNCLRVLLHALPGVAVSVGSIAVARSLLHPSRQIAEWEDAQELDLLEPNTM